MIDQEQERKHFISSGKPEDPIYTLGKVLQERGLNVWVSEIADQSDPRKSYPAMYASADAAKILRGIEEILEFRYLVRIQNTWPPIDEYCNNTIDPSNLWDEPTLKRVTATFYMNGYKTDITIANERRLAAGRFEAEAQRYEEKSRQDLRPWYRRIPLPFLYRSSQSGLFKYCSQKAREQAQYFTEEAVRYDLEAEDNDRWAKKILGGLKPLTKRDERALIVEIVDRHLPSPVAA